MNRRALLASLGASVAGLAGCQGPASRADRTSPLDTDTDTDTSTDASTSTRGYTTDRGGDLAVEPGPVEAPDLDWTVGMVSPPTGDRPARIRIALENAGPPRDLAVAGAMPYPPTPGKPADGDEGFRPAILPVDADHERQFWGSCWRSPLDDPGMADDAPWDWGHGEERTLTLGAGERIEGVYHLVSSTTRYCFQRGRYLFDRRYRLGGRSYEWSFALRVPSYSRDL